MLVHRQGTQLLRCGRIGPSQRLCSALVIQNEDVCYILLLKPAPLKDKPLFSHAVVYLLLIRRWASTIPRDGKLRPKKSVPPPFTTPVVKLPTNINNLNSTYIKHEEINTDGQMGRGTTLLSLSLKVLFRILNSHLSNLIFIYNTNVVCPIITVKNV